VLQLERLAGGLLGLAIWGLSAGPALAAPGDLDPSFGQGGRSELLAFRAGEVTDLALQSSGKILVTGDYRGATEDIFVARLLNPEGTLDPSYGLGSGWSRIDFGEGDRGGGLVMMPGGQIDISGGVTTTGPGGGRRFIVAQLLDPQGTFDPGFASGTGYLADRFNTLGTTADSDRSVAAARQGSSIIAAGTSGHSGGVDYAAVRVLSPAGVKDGNFASGGEVAYVAFFGSDDVARDVAVGPDGRIVLVGVTGPTITAGYIGVARLLADGSLDSSFDGDGKAVIQGSGEAAAVQPDGKIVVAGSSDGDFVVLRYDANGSLDPSFGSAGRAFVDFGSNFDRAYEMVLQPDGKIVVVGQAGQFAVARLQPNGTLDTTFGSGGKTSIDFTGPDDRAYAVALQPDGKVVVAGSSLPTGLPAEPALAVARLQGDPGVTKTKCAGKKATILGTNAKDKLKGTKKRDIVSAGKGKDSVKGLKGNDLICGGKGRDKLAGGPGRDKLLGEKGNDRLLGGPGKDKLKGGPGKKDKLNGGPGKDVEKP
jgi:uncharacterized delta-60 repeat protein